jgi:hypothetical protein
LIRCIGATARHECKALAVKMAGSLAAVLLNDLVVHYEKLAEQAALNYSEPN